ncbi:hypothetical protein B0H17DRAFT_1215983 [Mycena rosella]|uniref:Uncharacterized protein n=1 Tax=Mycena rosella TaxID=1033263 RepID=A0AAD7FVI8_MYCRO|nr:hypothetical protein B0H17DRAFT_1215983 [Mycena rosella]
MPSFLSFITRAGLSAPSYPPFFTLPQRGRARPVVRTASRLYAVHLPAPTVRRIPAIQVLLRLPLHGIERAVAGPYVRTR